jgi:conjugal transfer pilus assembly protein TraV
VKKTLIAITMLLLSGCALLNPYESSFTCPRTADGKCVSVQTAYQESTTPAVAKPAEPATEHPDDGCRGEHTSDSTCSDAKRNVTLNTPSSENRYRAALLDTFTGLLKDPVTPIVAPPKTMRVLLLPYTGQDNEFYMLRYVYFFIDEPRWLLGDSVSSGEEE